MDNRFLSRGMRVDNGAWVLGYVVNIGGMCGIVSQFGFDNKDARVIPVDPDTVDRCTGLKDKNDKSIFERDIFRDSLGKKAIVKWDEDNARFLGFTIEYEPRIAYVSRYPAVEIIGNIHEHPELMETQRCKEVMNDERNYPGISGTNQVHTR